MARRRAVVVSHAAGLSGMPSRVQRSSARSAASATASSARSQSPVVRIRAATMRSRSPAMASATARRAASSARPVDAWRRRPGRQRTDAARGARSAAIGCSAAIVDRLVEVGALEDVEAGDPFARLGERAVGHQHLAVRACARSRASAVGRSASPITRGPEASWRSTQSSTSSSLGSPVSAGPVRCRCRRTSCTSRLVPPVGSRVSVPRRTAHARSDTRRRDLRF